jgi:formate C-acetyltransferase
MNERVSRLRKENVNTKPYVSAKRALLLTEFYKNDAKPEPSTPVKRALAFKHLLENQTICINPGEDLETLDSREKTTFRVSEEVKRVYRETIIPFWHGKSMRKKVFAAMSAEWHAAFDAGLFTEFMEQRSPGHAILDDKIYHHGLLDFKEKIRAARATFDRNDLHNSEKDQELQAMEIACDALILFAARHAEKARDLAAQEADPKRKAELNQIAEICSRVPAHAPQTFWEALQAYWFVHLGVIIECNEWDSFNPGRLDQHLFPFYEEETAAGRLTPETAKELLECLWIKFSNQPAPPKVGVTEEQSSTYNDFVLINVGGLTANGTDAVNELSYLILDVIEEMRLPYTGTCIQLSKKNPDRFLKRALKIAKTGLGQPSIFNTDAIVQEFLRTGRRSSRSRCITGSIP